MANSAARADRAEAGAGAESDPVAGKSNSSGPFDAEAVGTALRAARIEMRRNYDDVTRDIRIRETHLRALEEGRLEDLPGPAYAAGFLRTYANYLGLIGAALAERLRAAGITPVQRHGLSLLVTSSVPLMPT